jgi:vacuolar-type H+-ATPase subunit F/Vma7
MRKIAFITPEQTGYGFQLTGAQQFYAKKKNMLDILKQVVLPSPKRPEAEVEDYAARLLRKAIGYHVRLRI